MITFRTHAWLSTLLVKQPGNKQTYEDLNSVQISFNKYLCCLSRVPFQNGVSQA